MAFPYGQRATATLENYAPKFTDNIFKSTPTLAFFQANAWVPYRGGNPITERVMHAKSNMVGFVGRGAIMTFAEQKFLDKAAWTPSTMLGTVFIPEQDSWDNMGEAQAIDLLKANTENVELSLKDALSTALFGSNAGQDELNLAGLLNFCTAATACGGITDGATYPWWAPQNDTTTANITRDLFATLYNNCSDGNDQPSLSVTTQALYEKLDFYLAPLMRLAGAPAPQVVQMGFKGLRYQNCEITYDSACPSGDLFMLNTRWLRVRPHTLFARKFQVKEVTLEQMAYASRYVWYGQLTCNNRRRLGLMTNKS